MMGKKGSHLTIVRRHRLYFAEGGAAPVMGGLAMNGAGLAAPCLRKQTVKQVIHPLVANEPFYNQDDRVSDAVIEGV